jgi:hypothetical protein
MNFTLRARILATLVSLGIGLPEGVARADEPAQTWYGYQTLAVDGSAIALALASAKAGPNTTGDVLGGVALAGFLLGGPSVHVAHGHVSKGLGDLALRVGAPVVAGLVGGVIGAALYEPPPPPPPSATVGEAIGSAVAEPVTGLAATLEGVFYGALVGGAIAIGTDAAVLSHEAVKADVPAKPVEAPRATLRPSILPSRSGATAGIAGTF